MLRRTSSRPLASICLQCQWHIANQRRTLHQRLLRKDELAPRIASRPSKREFHLTTCSSQLQTSSPPSITDPPTYLSAPDSTLRKLPIRQHLEAWEDKFGGAPDDVKAFEHRESEDAVQNQIASINYNVKADEDMGHEQWAPSLEDDGDDLITIGLYLKPGDVVELSVAGHEPVLAVFIRQLGLLGQFYSVNGRWNHARTSSVSFAVPGAIDPVLLEPLIPYLPTDIKNLDPKTVVSIPRDLGAPVVALLNQLTQDSERIYRDNAPALDSAFFTLAHESMTRMLTLTQIARLLLGKGKDEWDPSPAALVATRKALKHNEYRFRSDARSQRLTNVFTIRAKRDVDVVDNVHRWIREYQDDEAALATGEKDHKKVRGVGAGHIRDFLNKAKSLVAESRQRRKPYFSGVGPDEKRISSHDSSGLEPVIWGVEFTKADQLIIMFLEAWVLTDQFRNMPTLHSACASLLHATKCYDNVDTLFSTYTGPAQMGRSTGLIFLQEIGVVTPFENVNVYNETLMLPTVRATQRIESLKTEVAKIESAPKFEDTMKDLRRDWGSTTVFCIDGAGAKEIDDGVSIERVPGEPSEYWIHVHVANPTAFFGKSHPLSGMAAHMTESVYTAERTFPMLPSWVAQEHFSLRNDRPTLTFSARIDDAGNTLDYKIQNGIVRNVVSITPEELAAYIGEPSRESVVRLRVGGEPTTGQQKRSLPELTQLQLENLRDLYSAAKALWKGRKAAGATMLAFEEKVDAAVYRYPGEHGLEWMPPARHRVRRVIGDPIIELRSRQPKHGGKLIQAIDASNIVEEMMQLACRVAGTWCAERNIPVMFRGTVEDPSQPFSLQQFREEILEPHIAKYGDISIGVKQLYHQALGRAIAHWAPVPHQILGSKHYVKVTSPLRRFSDMIAHWQIEAALRREDRTGHKLATLDSPGTFVFTLPQLREAIITLSPREKLIAQTKKRANNFWVAQAFMRAFRYKEAELPGIFTATVQWRFDSGYATAYVEDYGVDTFSLIPSPGLEYQVGDRWEVKIYDFDVLSGNIRVEPVRLMHREEALTSSAPLFRLGQ